MSKKYSFTASGPSPDSFTSIFSWRPGGHRIKTQHCSSRPCQASTRSSTRHLHSPVKLQRRMERMSKVRSSSCAKAGEARECQPRRATNSHTGGAQTHMIKLLFHIRRPKKLHALGGNSKQHDFGNSGNAALLQCTEAARRVVVRPRGLMVGPRSPACCCIASPSPCTSLCQSRASDCGGTQCTAAWGSAPSPSYAPCRSRVPCHLNPSSNAPSSTLGCTPALGQLRSPLGACGHKR